MAVDTSVFLFYTLFQLGGIAILLRPEWARPATERLALGALLVVNGAQSALLAAETVGFDAARGTQLALVIDAPTAPLLFSYLAFLMGRRRWGFALIGVAGALLLLGAISPALMAGGAFSQFIASYAYFAALAGVVVKASTGDEHERWVALAFLPRALLFATQVSFGPDLLRPYAIAAFALAAAAILAAVRLSFARGPGPSPALVLGAMGLGIADAVAWRLLPADPSMRLPGAVLNFFTLAFARPLFLYVAYAPSQFARFLARTTFASGVGALGIAIQPLIGWTPFAGLIVAFSISSFTLTMLMVWPKRSSANAPPPPTKAVPQWQALLSHLLREGATPGATPTASWTQRCIAEATGISPKRISEFPRDLNASATAKLDAFCPGWRSRATEREPLLVTTHRGAVDGMAGVWTYYRLTMLGVELGEAVEGSRGDPQVDVRGEPGRASSAKS